jgi:hypothetical protein
VSAPPRRRAPSRVLLAALALHAWPAAAWATTCAVVPGASEFAIEDVGRVVFEQLATDRSAASVTFGGGVCLEVAGERITIRAESLRVSGLDGVPLVSGEGAVVRSESWLLGAVRLEASQALVRLEDATLSGDGLVGLARVLELRTSDGSITGSDLMVATPSVRVDLAEGSFDGRVLEGRGVALSTCDCPPSEAGLRLEGDTFAYELDTEVLRLGRGALRVGGVRIPLPSAVTLSEAELAQLRLPLTVARDERRGWLIGLPERAEDGVTTVADLALSDLEPPRLRSAISAAAGGGSLALALTSGGVEVRTAATRPLGSAVTLSLSQRLRVGLVDPMQDAVVRLAYGPDRALTAVPPGGVAGRAEAALGLTAQRRGDVELASARALAAVRLDAASAQSELGTVRLRLEAGATGYAALPASQLWWSAAPRWDLRRPGFTATLAHAHRAVLGQSPFDRRVDLVEPLELTTLAVTWRGADDAWRLDGEARYSWLLDDRRPGRRVGPERLRLVGRTGAVALVEGGPTLQFSGALEVAGWADPRPERDAFVRLSVRAVWPDARPELGVAATVGLVPGATGFRDLTVSAGTPLRWPDRGLELRPYVAYDVWPTLAGAGWPILRAHGLALVWQSPYGTLDAGYRSEPDGSVTSSLAFRVEARQPTLEDLRR